MAKAIRDVVGICYVVVAGPYCRIGDPVPEIPLPAEVLQWIRRYDERLPSLPFEFELDWSKP